MGEVDTISEHITSRQDPEWARLEAVERYRVVGAPRDAVLERAAALAARFFDAPMAKVVIIDGTHTWLVATHGFGDPPRRIPREDGLCVDEVVRGGPHIVHDVGNHPSYSRRRFAVEHEIGFFACAPIVTFDGHRIGAIVICDTEPRDVSEGQLGVLNDLAAIVMEQLELRLSLLDTVRDERQLRAAAEFARSDAEFDRDTARRDLDVAQRDRDEAVRDRDDAQTDRDDAVRDRGIAERERDVVEEYATVLQRTLLPPSLPTVAGLTLAAHYHPASPRQVGGDFYDVFSLGAHRWAFFIGDIEGHGAAAAAATSLVRYTLRSAALHHAECSDVLVELNDVLLREMRPRRLCTVLYGTITPQVSGFGLVLATGGHQPGLLVDPGRDSVEVVRSATGMLVGATPNATFGTLDLELTRGQILLLFTDGIVEARRGAAPFDIERLAAFAAEHGRNGAQALVDDIATLIPKLDPSDDVAVLAFEVT